MSQEANSLCSVFISHSSLDEFTTKGIERALTEIGCSCVVDYTTLETGDGVSSTLIERIRDCDEFLVLITPASLPNTNVWFEVGVAWNAGKRVIGIVSEMNVQEARNSPFMPFSMQDIRITSVNNLGVYISELQNRYG